MEAAEKSTLLEFERLQYPVDLHLAIEGIRFTVEEFVDVVSRPVTPTGS